MPALLLAFAVWVVWSVIVVELPRIGFKFTTNQLFWLAALPGISGAVFRALYSFVVPIFGRHGMDRVEHDDAAAANAMDRLRSPGSAHQLCSVRGDRTAVWSGRRQFLVVDGTHQLPLPEAPAGHGAGRERRGEGDLGVGLAQLIAPLAMYSGALLLVMGGSAQTREVAGAVISVWVQNAGFIWVPLIVLSVIAAWFGMDNIASVRAGFAEQVAILRNKQQWRMSWLYLGTFGSFIGLAAGFPMLVNTQFPAVDAFSFAFVGPLVGALVRPIGGWLADRVGGARITVGVFIVMTIAPLAAAFFLPAVGAGGSLMGFVLAFIALFVAAGVGNGSTFRMIPIIFRTLREREVRDPSDKDALEAARRVGATEGAATLGFSSAVAALGLAFIPIAYGTSINLTGSPAAALVFFSVFYLSCLVGTWHWYARRGAEVSC